MEVVTSEKFKVITDMDIMFELTEAGAVLPHRAEEGSSCYDLFSNQDIELKSGEIALVSTGLRWQPNTISIEMQIRPRSGLALKHGITVLNSPGTVDASYRGIIKVILINHGKQPYQIKAGDRIAQAFFQNVDKRYNLVLIDKVTEDNERGQHGFGSTGR